MLAFIGTTVSKSEIIAQLEAHARADEIVQGVYWEEDRGCAVGCTIHSSNHAEYETRFGILQMLARLEDCIFEGLPIPVAREWPLRFMGAVQPGSDLSFVGWQFLYWLLTDEKVNPGSTHDLVRDEIRKCVDILALFVKGESLGTDVAASAASAAYELMADKLIELIGTASIRESINA